MKKTFPSIQNQHSTLNKNTSHIEPPQQTISADQVIEMFESQYTSQLHDRKANAIIRFCRERKVGLFYEEINQLIKMIDYAIKDLIENQVQEMVEAIQKICEVASLPFKKLRTSDELKFVPLMPNFLNCFKLLLFNPNSNNVVVNELLLYQVILFLKAFSQEGVDEIINQEANFENKKIQSYELSPMQILMTNGTKNLRAIDKSIIVEDIIFTMQQYQKNYDFLFPLLELISDCILYKELAQKFANFGILKDIIYVIFDCEDFRSYIVKQCFEIIWNAIEAVGIQIMRLFASEDIIQQLKKLFENIMKNGYKSEDKCLRNELLILINYLLGDPQALPFFVEKQNITSQDSPTTFLDVLLFYASIDEVTFYNEPIRTNQLKAFFGTTSEDIEFKKLLWSGILQAVESNIIYVLDLVKESPFVITLLLYIDPLANSYAVNRWSQPQLREIQSHCLSVLANLIIYLKDDFYEKNGLFCLTKFLTNTNDIDHKEKCLKAFNNASLFDQQYKLKISDEGVMDNLVEFLQHDNDNPLEIKELCYSIISNLCKECNKNKKLFRQKGGVDMVVNSLKDDNLGTSTRYALYAVSILDCLWNSILGNRKSETFFLDNEGLYVLLEFLEICDDMHKKMALSCISYLIENPKTIPYFCDWNSGKTMINATQLLIKIYDKEDQRYGVKYDDGIIVNKDRPLNPMTDPQYQRKYQQASDAQTFDDFNDDQRTKTNNRSGLNQKALQATAQKVDQDVGTEAYLVRKIKMKVEEYDLRAIVFAILYRVGFDKNELHPGEKQKIEVIQLYPHFKMGEIWNDIKFELEKEGIKATSDDLHWLMTNIEEAEEQIENCISTQSMIAREHRRVQEEDLNRFYDIIKSNKLTK